jgi:hypothetical protein
MKAADRQWPAEVNTGSLSTAPGHRIRRDL